MNALLRRSPRSLLQAGLLACALALGAGVQAGESVDHELARRALESGRVLPLATVLDKLAREVPGQVLKVEFEREAGRFVYEIRLLQDDGRMAKLEVDAVDARVLSIKLHEAGKVTDAHPRGGR